MIKIEDWSVSDDTWYCFHASYHDDDTYDFNHVLKCSPRNERIICADGAIADTKPDYIGKNVYVWRKFYFNQNNLK